MTNPPPISLAERQSRLAALRTQMEAAGVATVLLGSTSSLRYFTGIDWGASERLVGALVHASGGLDYITPQFELEKVEGLISLPGEILSWEEDESPWRLVADRIGPTGRLAVDDRMALAMFRSLRAEIDDAARGRRAADPSAAQPQVAGRDRPDVPRQGHHHRGPPPRPDQLHAGQRASEVVRFIDEQHRALGGSGQLLLHRLLRRGHLPAARRGRRSGAGRGRRGADRHRHADRRLQLGHHPHLCVRRGEPGCAARLGGREAGPGRGLRGAATGRALRGVDAAARRSLEADGFGPGYSLPGLPHRTGHGIGLDIHEGPYLVKGDARRWRPACASPTSR
jgi:Xaa-Pro dipeptidase